MLPSSPKPAASSNTSTPSLLEDTLPFGTAAEPSALDANTPSPKPAPYYPVMACFPQPHPYALCQPIEPFLASVEVYLQIVQISEDKKAAALITLLSPEAQQQIFKLGLGPSISYEELKREIRKLFQGQKRPIQSFDSFCNRKQRPNETNRQFAASLASLAENAFPAAKPGSLEPTILSQFVRGIFDPKVQEDLINEDPLTIDDAVDMADKCKLNRDTLRDLRNRQTAIHALHDGEFTQTSPAHSVQPPSQAAPRAEPSLADQIRPLTEQLQQLTQLMCQQQQFPSPHPCYQSYFEPNYANQTMPPPSNVATLNSAPPQRHEPPQWSNQACFQCGMPGHFARFCERSPPNANFAQEYNHLLSRPSFQPMTNANPNSRFPAPTPCGICNRTNHSTQHCFYRNAPVSRSPIPCSRCNTFGHTTQNCTIRLCSYCGHANHTSSDCQIRKREQQRDSQHRTNHAKTENRGPTDVSRPNIRRAN
jgi:hypothetical protein